MIALIVHLYLNERDSNETVLCLFENYNQHLLLLADRWRVKTTESRYLPLR